MTAPDPGLTDLIAAHQERPHHDGWICSCGAEGPERTHPAHVALVVEQHTNGRMAELEATIARVEALADSSSGRIVGRDGATGVPLFSLRAALEGEQQ